MKITKTELEEIIREAFNELAEEIDEARIKKVVRGGKLKRKVKCKPGQKAVKGRCVTMRGAEKAKRRRATKKTAARVKGKRARMNKKRRKSMRRRRSFGL